MDLMKLKRKEGQIVDVSILLRKENNKIMVNRGWAGLGRRKKGRGEKGVESGIREDGRDVQRVRKLNRDV